MSECHSASAPAYVFSPTRWRRAVEPSMSVKRKVRVSTRRGYGVTEQPGGESGSFSTAQIAAEGPRSASSQCFPFHRPRRLDGGLVWESSRLVVAPITGLPRVAHEGPDAGADAETKGGRDLTVRTVKECERQHHQCGAALMEGCDSAIALVGSPRLGASTSSSAANLGPQPPPARRRSRQHRRDSRLHRPSRRRRQRDRHRRPDDKAGCLRQSQARESGTTPSREGRR